MVDKPEIRLELLKLLVPTASKVEMNDATKLIEKATALEAWVLASDQKGGQNRRSTGKRGDNSGVDDLT